MNGTQLERVLNLIDANLALNRDEIIRYIQDHETEIVEQMDKYGKIEIPTSVGRVTILKNQIAA